MNCSYHIIESLGIILIHKKRCTAGELKNLISEIVQNPFYKKNYDVIFDLRDTEFKLSFKDFKGCSNYLESNLPLKETNKLALVTKTAEQTRKAIDFLLCYKGNPECQVFTDIRKAFDWMDLKNKLIIVKNRLNYLRHQESYFYQ